MSVCFSVDQFLRICPGLTPSRALEILPPMELACAKYDISTPRRLAAAIATWTHETGNWRFLAEVWGPTKQQLKYDPPGKLAEHLGNTSSGDGFKYRGRGPTMLTGRANYRVYGRVIGAELEQAPELVERLDVGFEVAGAYWRDRRLNGPADQGDFEACVLIVNGGLTDFPKRRAIYDRACAVLGFTPPKQLGDA